MLMRMCERAVAVRTASSMSRVRQSTCDRRRRDKRMAIGLTGRRAAAARPANTYSTSHKLRSVEGRQAIPVSVPDATCRASSAPSPRRRRYCLLRRRAAKEIQLKDGNKFLWSHGGPARGADFRRGVQMVPGGRIEGRGCCTHFSSPSCRPRASERLTRLKQARAGLLSHCDQVAALADWRANMNSCVLSLGQCNIPQQGEPPRGSVFGFDKRTRANELSALLDPCDVGNVSTVAEP